jgi:hypothetical protein
MAKKKGQTPPRAARMESRGRPGQIRPTADRARKRRRANIITGTIVTLLLGGAIAFVVLRVLGSGRPDSPPPGVQTFEVDSAEHVEGTVDYEQDPPVGGNHNAVWQNCGFYAFEIANENAVHSLEHGAVWITYSPDLSEDDVDVIRDLARRTFVLASEYPDLPSPVVASAWGLQLELDGVDDPKLEQFVDFYRQGPQTPEPGSTCTGGTGNPS